MGTRLRCPGCRQVVPVVADRPDRSLRCPRCGRPCRLPSATETAPERIARFRLLSRVGTGAFAVVYRAFDPQLEREVALKVPRADTLERPHAVERFLREARAAAQLRHPYIVPVFEAGRDGEHHYIASAFIAGQTLAQAHLEGRLGVRRAVEIVRALAEALAYAHRRGIVHRDVKPANVLLDAQGRPYLADFGLAYQHDEAGRLTQSGTLLGTPAYIAPEQIEGRGEQAEPGCDQYSLGVLLYELLTGQIPFRGTSSQVLFHVVHTEPPSPRSLRPDLPLDLETICLVALAKRPRDRYASCQELADDLRRFLEGEPIKARRRGPLERLGRWLGREPVLAALLLIAVLSLLTAAIWAMVGNSRLRELARQAGEARQAAEQARREEDTARKQAEERHRAIAEARQRSEDEQRRAQSALGQEEQMLTQAKAARQRALTRRQEAERVYREAEEARKAAAEARLREQRFQAEAMALGNQGRYQVLGGHPAPVAAVAFRPDGRLVSTDTEGNLEVWDVATGKRVADFQGPGRCEDRVGISIDGRFQALEPEKAALRIRDTWDGKVLTSLAPEVRFVHCPCFSPDGKLLAGSPARQVVKVWEAGSGKEVATLKGPAGHVYCLRFSPDGKHLAAAFGFGAVRVWDVATGAERVTFGGYTDNTDTLCFSPDGKRLAAAAGVARIKVWDAGNGSEVEILRGAPRNLTFVCFSPDGRYLAAGAVDGTVKLWHADGRDPIATFHEHTGAIRGLCFTPDGKRLASASADRRIILWKTTRP